MSAVELVAESSWQPLDLAVIVQGTLSGEVVGPVPKLLSRSDGQALIYPGEVHAIFGEPEVGKGWLMLYEAARLLAAGESVLYLDFEDAPASVIGRLLALGVDPVAILDCFVYVQPQEVPPLDWLAQLLAHGPFDLAVVDGLSEAYNLLGLDYTSNRDVPEFLRCLARPLAASGAAVVQIDHVTKDKNGRGRNPIGGQHKLAGVAVAYGIEVIDRPSRTSAGRVKLTLAKDRHGHVPGGHGVPVALVTITPADEGRKVTVTVDPPDGLDDAGSFRPTNLMEKVSRYVETHPGAGVNGIKKGVRGNNDYKDVAIDALVGEGWMTVERQGQRRVHTVVRPFREHDEATDPPPIPTDPRDRCPQPIPPVPSPSRGDRGRDRAAEAQLTIDRSHDTSPYSEENR